ncbi:MAG: DUF1385 domain-containing protein [Acidimicrobiia bacterium]|nr:DUF1385 domain-containing protein [Acidimicrobiia bacterium]
MMRAPHRWAVAVRRPDGIIEAIRHELPRLSARSWAARVPFLRGVMVLVESMQLGFRALSWSAQKAGEDDEELTRGQIITTMVVAVVLALALFIGAPVAAASFLHRFFDESSLAFVVIDGLVRIALIVTYIWAISRASEIKRVFEYHGAEHMTIHAYEAGDPLGVAEVSRYSPRHPRCGTSFIVLVAMVAFVIFLTLATLPLLWQIIARVVLIPVIAGTAYEVLKAAADTRWLAWASLPGIWLQAITTERPTPDQIEVAIASLLAALTVDERFEVDARGPVAVGALEAVYDPASD